MCHLTATLMTLMTATLMMATTDLPMGATATTTIGLAALATQAPVAPRRNHLALPGAVAEAKAVVAAARTGAAAGNRSGCGGSRSGWGGSRSGCGRRGEVGRSGRGSRRGVRPLSRSFQAGLVLPGPLSLPRLCITTIYQHNVPLPLQCPPKYPYHYIHGLTPPKSFQPSSLSLSDFASSTFPT